MKEQDNGASLHQCDMYGVYGYGYGCLGVVMCLNSQPYLSMSLWLSLISEKQFIWFKNVTPCQIYGFLFLFSFFVFKHLFRISYLLLASTWHLVLLILFFRFFSFFSFLLSNGLFTVHCACHIYITYVYISCGLWIIGKQRTCERIMIATWNIKCMYQGTYKK